MASDAAPPPLLLAFDTSAAQCAAALVRGGRLLATRTEAMDRGQAERLLPLLEEILAEAGVAWSDLDGLAVVTGPGNFTGLRIAVAAARGLALGLDRPAVGISRFEVLAAGVDGPVLVGLDDRRGGIAVQAFDRGTPLGPPAPGWPTQAPLPGTLCLGDGAEAAAAALGLGHRPAGSEPAADLALVARLAAARLQAGQPPPPAPLYLRPADAAPPREAAPALLDDA